MFGLNLVVSGPWRTLIIVTLLLTSGDVGESACGSGDIEAPDGRGLLVPEGPFAYPWSEIGAVGLPTWNGQGH